MKGITHFSVGVAVASCFPQAVAAGAEGNSLYFVLGGVFGLLPDTLDFKFYRFFYRHDIEIIPDPLRPDPQMIADGIARAVNMAYEKNRPVKVKLGTIRLGPDIWQRYGISFDAPGQSVSVDYGPVVDTGGTSLTLESESVKVRGRALLLCPVKLDYTAVTNVDILDGPVFVMEPASCGLVIPRFIPWHREWSHSFVVSLLAGIPVGLLYGPLAGLVAFLAWASHIAADQFGYMGSSLLYPFSSKRYPGWQYHNSGSAPVNLSVVWASCLVIFWNLAKARLWVPDYFLLPRLLFYGLILPLVVWRYSGRVIEIFRNTLCRGMRPAAEKSE